MLDVQQNVLDVQEMQNGVRHKWPWVSRAIMTLGSRRVSRSRTALNSAAQTRNATASTMAHIKSLINALLDS